MGRLEEIAARAERATPGEWVPRCIEKQIYTGRYALYASGPPPMFVDSPWLWTESRFDQIKADADFIAYARQDVPWLLEQLKMAKRAMELAIQSAPSYLGQSETKERPCVRRLLGEALAALDEPESVNGK